MPILDPSLQNFLLNKHPIKKSKNRINFFLKYLLIASRNIHRSLTTIEAANQFSKDLEKYTSFFNDELGFELTTKNLSNLYFTNIFQYIYDSISSEKIDERKNIRKLTGKYFMLSNYYSTKFFIPDTLHSKRRSWVLSDTPIAILVINSSNFKHKNRSSLYQLVKLEIDLMQAAGLTLVLCASFSPEIKKFLYNLIKDNQFSEIHFNIDELYADTFLMEKGKSNILSLISCMKGYFYLYSHFFQSDQQSYLKIKELKKNPNFKLMTFGKNVQESLKNIHCIDIEPFVYCQTGFKYRFLKIYLCDVPLYETENENKNSVPSQLSGLSQCYISPDDFLNWKTERIKILFEDKAKNDHSYEKYVDFDDLHLIREQYYVNSTIDLMKIDETKYIMVDIVDQVVQSIIKNKKKKKFRKRASFFIRKFQNDLEQAIYAYTYYMNTSNYNFSIHKTQIYTILYAFRTILNKEYLPLKNNSNGNITKDQKGIIYQIETGEGKSCISVIVAAILALSGKTVHITSSNIKLSNRDYVRSYDFFKLLGLRSAILLHENELPSYIANKMNEKDKNEVNNYKNGRNEESDDIPNDTSSDDDNNDNYGNDDIYGNYDNDDIYVNYGNHDIYGNYGNDVNNETYNNESENDRFYANKDFYSSKAFKNSTGMNFCVCGFNNDDSLYKKKANIIFSTFLHLESLYLRMIEHFPAYVDKYFSNCVLLVDEADSILIDEIENGTIISREIKSNSKEVLTYVYNQKQKGCSPESTFNDLKSQYPRWRDLKLSDIKKMFDEIELIIRNKYREGVHYTIGISSENKKTNKKGLIKKVLNYTGKLALKSIKGIILDFNNNEEEEIDDDDDDENEDDDDDDENENENNNNNNIFYEIVPFDSKNKGISEPNKEFDGFTQQFIAIYRSDPNYRCHCDNLIVKEKSISYLYISHPIFVKLYGNVCGFTGTIGNRKDQDIYQKQYELITTKVPRNSPNRIVNLPILLCDNFEERNKKILEDIVEFHSRGNPVLVIFKDLDEINYFKEYLIFNEIYFFNIYDGINEIINPEIIAGVKSSITISTNYCGRGTNIKIGNKQLHVILSYYTSNSRVMKQAYGRTGRQGQRGTTRIICLRYQYYKCIYMNSDNSELNENLKKSSLKNKMQIDFINHFKDQREWIFNPNKIDKQVFTISDIKKMRKFRINVNRIVACNFKYPIIMKIKTFLKIQTQKIFSIINCPNCIYTWRIFQRYVREMILQSWSMMMNKFDYKYNNQNYFDFNSLFTKKVEKLKNKLEEFLPNNTDLDIIPTFMNICDKVISKYQQQVLHQFHDISNVFWQFNNSSILSVQAGFKPFSLLSGSGARIVYKNLKKMNYIKDPELKYEQREPRTKKLTILSITQKIDDIFNNICQKINEILGKKTFLKFFLRRMLCGCEFGICLNFKYENTEDEDPTMLIDKDPLFLFTINVRSLIPILSGILIFVLVYLAFMAKKIGEWFMCFPEKLTKEVALRCVSVVVNVVAPELAHLLLDKIIKFLDKSLKNQIDILKNIDESKTIIIEKIIYLFNSSLGQDFTKIITNKISDCIKITFNWQKLIKSCLDPVRLMKISFLILINLIVFIMNLIYAKIKLDNTILIQKNMTKTQLKISLIIWLKTKEILKNLMKNSSMMKRSKNKLKNHIRKFPNHIHLNIFFSIH